MSTYRVSKNADVSRSRKRECYTRVACDTCKIRKVKCSGHMPCSRCAELRSECKYPLLENAMAQIKQDPRHVSETSSQSLPELLSAMKKICEDIESSSNHIGPISANSRASLERRHIEHHNGKFKNAFATPVNLSYPLNLARACMEELRAASTTSTEQDQHDPPAPAKTDPSTDMTAVIAQEAQEILDIGYNEVLRLLAVFNREIYHMYPCINIEFARREIDFLFSHSLPPPSRGKHTKFDMDLIDIEITKVVLAIAMLTQNQTQSQLCSDLETHLIWNTDLVMKQEAVQLEDVIMATLMTIYFIQRDQAMKAWRMSGFAAKACLELGLQQEKSVDAFDESPADLAFVQDLFLCVYNLDKRCSFYANLPWTLVDKDINDNIFDLNGRHPFLSTMVRLDRIHSEIIEFANSSQSLSTKDVNERAELLGYRLDKYMESLDKEEILPLQLSEPLPLPTTQAVMQAFIALRTNHIRMFTDIRCLSSPEIFISRPKSAHALISRAISSVDFHSNIVAAGGDIGITSLLQSTVYKLLTTSLSCMFLAASYNPPVFGPLCCRAFHTAIDILSKTPRPPSTSGMDTLWSSLEDLRIMGESVQMPRPDTMAPLMGSPRMGVQPPEMQRQQLELTFDAQTIFTSQGGINSEYLDSIGHIYSSYDFLDEQLSFA